MIGFGSPLAAGPGRGGRDSALGALSPALVRRHPHSGDELVAASQQGGDAGASQQGADAAAGGMYVAAGDAGDAGAGGDDEADGGGDAGQAAAPDGDDGAGDAKAAKAADGGQADADGADDAAGQADAGGAGYDGAGYDEPPPERGGVLRPFGEGARHRCRRRLGRHRSGGGRRRRRGSRHRPLLDSKTRRDERRECISLGEIPLLARPRQEIVGDRPGPLEGALGGLLVQETREHVARLPRVNFLPGLNVLGEDPEGLISRRRLERPSPWWCDGWRGHEELLSGSGARFCVPVDSTTATVLGQQRRSTDALSSASRCCCQNPVASNFLIFLLNQSLLRILRELRS